MKQRLLNMYNDPRYSKLFEWGKLLSITGIGQIAVQATGFISGILVIRLLSTEEYALYTLANTMLGTMTLLADGGIASGVMAEGGKVWKDREKLGAVMTTGINLRKKFAFISLLIALPILFILLRRHDASWLMSILIIVSLIPAYISALSNSLLQIVPKLHQDIKSLQKNQVEVNVLRLILSGLTLFAFPWAFVAVLASGIPQIWSNKKLKGISEKFLVRSKETNTEVRESIMTIVKRTLPGSIYYCISGQITVWVISIFGSTQSIAQIGALSRLMLILNIAGMMVSTLLEPRFSRLPNNGALLVKRFFQILAILLAFCTCIILLVWLFPDQILSILGKGYNNLSIEVLMMVTGSCLSLISGNIHRLNSSRGIIPPAYVFIPMIIVVQVSVLSIIDLSTLRGVLWFSIFPPIVGSIFRIGYFLLWVKKHTYSNVQ